MSWLEYIPGYRQTRDAASALQPRRKVLRAGTGIDFADVSGETEISVTAGGVTSPTNPGDDGKVALASTGDLTYLAGTVSGQVLTWNGTAWAAAAAAAGGYTTVENNGTPVTTRTTLNLPTGSGLVAADAGAKTTLTVAALTTTHLSASAAIAATQLAAGGAGNVLLGGASNSWGKVTTSHISASAGIVGTQLSATAAIAGTQLAAGANIAASQLAAGATGTVLAGGSPNAFTADPSVTSLTASSFLAAGGGTLADAGAVRLAKASLVAWRNNGDTANNTLGWTADALEAYAGANQIIKAAYNNFEIWSSSNKRAVIVASSMTLYNACAFISWDGSSVNSPTLRHNNTSGSITNMTVRAQGKASGTGDGGHLLLQGGKHSSGLRGAVRLQLNPDDSAFESMVEVVEIATGRRVVALARGADLTTTQMPTGTGDGVVFMATAATAPTAAPVSGAIMDTDASGNVWVTNTAGVRSQIN